MKLAIASDHAGFSLKEIFRHFLSTQPKVRCEDLGPFSEVSVDYPDYAASVAKKVSSGEADAGILVCGTGLGMILTANKFKNVRATLISDPHQARLAKEHNNANVVGFSGRPLEALKNIRLLRIWLKSTYKGGRHRQRLEKISQIEEENFKKSESIGGM